MEAGCMTDQPPPVGVFLVLLGWAILLFALWSFDWRLGACLLGVSIGFSGVSIVVADDERTP
jgi:hypothetical protein